MLIFQTSDIAHISQKTQRGKQIITVSLTNNLMPAICELTNSSVRTM